MALYQKVDGVWVQAQRPYVKRGNSWTAGQQAYVKQGGQWVSAWQFDTTPTEAPVITLAFHEEWTGSKLKTRYIRVGARLPAATHDPELRQIRVLTTYNGAAPTSAFGQTYTSAPDTTYPAEPWSEWRYNEFGAHKDSSTLDYKQWPPNAASGTIVPASTKFFFTAWAQDRSGNWSLAQAADVTSAKNSVDMAAVITKEARFTPTVAGTWWTAKGFQSGDLLQQRSPKAVGMWFYGTQIVDTIGQHTTGKETVKVQSAQIYIQRLNDGGSGNANIYLFWTHYAAPANLPPVGTALVREETTYIGQLAKGQGKWFTIPSAFYNNLNLYVRGMGLHWKNENKADAVAADYSKVQSMAANLRCGEIHIVWQESL